MRILNISVLTLGLLLDSSLVWSDESVHTPLVSNSGGAFSVEMSINGVSDRFLLDTGAAMLTVNADLFKRLARAGSATKQREVVARLADGRTRRLSVYKFDYLQIAEGCVLESVEAVVVPGKGRNLLGLNVLSRFAPFSMAVEPPSISLSHCEEIRIAGVENIHDDPSGPSL